MALHPEPADLVGVTTLERISAAPAFNRWMFDRLRRWVGRRVLEVGAGVGNLSQFLADRERVALSDTEAYYLARLRERFAGRANVAVVELRLPDSSGYELCEFIRASPAPGPSADARSSIALRRLRAGVVLLAW